MAEKQRDFFRESFKKVKFLSATTDIWSKSNKSFIAVTVHYFEELKLKSKFIACEYFAGQHTHDKVANKLKSIFERFGILEKVFFTTTDGAGEYTAAFRYFGNNYRSIRLQENLEWLEISGVGASHNAVEIAGGSASNSGLDSSSSMNQGNANGNHCSDSESDSSDDDDTFIFNEKNEHNSNVNAAGTTNDSSESFRIEELPVLRGMNRIDCSAHKLEKVGGKDSLNAKSDSNYSDLYDKTFEKLEKIWHLKESRLKAEIFTRITGKKLIGPHRIRWMKKFNAVSILYLLR